MTGIYLTGFILGYIAMYPRVFRFVLEDFSFGRPEKEDVLDAGFLSLIMTLFWPLIVLALIFDKVVLAPLSERVIKEYKR